MYMNVHSSALALIVLWLPNLRFKDNQILGSIRLSKSLLSPSTLTASKNCFNPEAFTMLVYESHSFAFSPKSSANKCFLSPFHCPKDPQNVATGSNLTPTAHSPPAIADSGSPIHLLHYDPFYQNICSSAGLDSLSKV